MEFRLLHYFIACWPRSILRRRRPRARPKAIRGRFAHRYLQQPASYGCCANRSRSPSQLTMRRLPHSPLPSMAACGCDVGKASHRCVA